MYNPPRTMTDNNENIDLPDDTVIYGNARFDVGVDADGNGYVECRPRKQDPFRFPTPLSKVKDFARRQSANSPPMPTSPEDAKDSVQVPENWTGGKVEHTGGGIWCRIFRKSLDNGHIEVIYNARDRRGVTAGVYGDDGAWLGEIDTIEATSEPGSDEELVLKAANELMECIDNGQYGTQITELVEEKQMEK
jgi:hypothetical protein